MHLLIALSFILLHNVDSCSCRSVAEQRHAPEPAGSYEFKRDEVPELLKQFLKQRSSKVLDGELVQKNVANTTEPYTENNVSRIEYRKRDPAQPSKKRRKTITPLAIIVTNLPEFTRLRSRGVGGKTKINTNSQTPSLRNQLKVKQHQNESSREDDINELVDGYSNRNMVLDVSNDLDVSMERDVASELDISKERDVASELDVTKKWDVAGEPDLSKERDVANELDISKERDVVSELDLAEKWDVASEPELNTGRDVANELDVSKEIEVASESDVNKDRDVANELVVNKETDIAGKPDISKEKDVASEPDDKDKDVANELDVSKETDVAGVPDISKERDVASEVIKERNVTKKLIIPQENTASFKDNEEVADDLRDRSYKQLADASLPDAAPDDSAAVTGGGVNKIVIDPDLKLKVVTDPGADGSVAGSGPPARYPETRARCEDTEGDTDWTQRHGTRSTYNISFLFNR